MHNNSLLQNLNDAQRQAVLHGEGPALIAAGPGSGKTYVITCRLLYLIQERKVPPQEILVITFTKEAARSMQERFLKQLQESGNNRTFSTGFVSFGTFHSYFYQIIRSIKTYSEYQLITQQEKVRIAREVLKEASEDDVTDANINEFLRQVSFYKNTGRVKEGASGDTLQVLGGSKKSSDNDAIDEKAIFFERIRQYEHIKSSYKKLDFDDMLWLCRKVLAEDNTILAYWQRRFSYILIDEFQDINPIQYEIIKMLCRPPYNLFVVGDDDQAIYGFRGSDAEIFQRFLRDYKNAAQITLNINYRCAQSIVEASKRVIEENKKRLHKELVSCDKNALKGQIRLVKAIHTRESYGNVANSLKEKTTEQLNNEAVLFRTNSAMQMFATELSKNNIPFVLREKCESIYEHFIVKDIMDYFQAAAGCRERGLFLRIFQKQRVYMGREALREKEVDLQKVKDFYKKGIYENRPAVEQIEILERHLKRLSTMRPKLGINYILHAMDYEGYLRRKAGTDKELSEEWRQLIEWLMEDAGDYIDFKSWQVHQEIYAEELKREVLEQKQEKKGIRLLTLHASKGLEFDKVYLMNLNEGTLPKYRKGEEVTEERIEEERRLFYVGMTRAKEELEIHYIIGTRENPRFPSRFLGILAKTIWEQ